ncbi:Lysine/cadaverine antiporter membrane protein CadB [Klebsiella pneumoniae]|uniref:Lysine/cadaverine antiporter membrane protein CadB n=1 Tax=Klebsiella pneumoniae TaxID=573 RepID=A0A447S248_KLEPN|nr:Lysine/cadaverine antiporter membrane protein CadB [Klebsiella pneumoniae]
MSSAKKIGLFACTGVVAGNMMGSGIALLPANLASIGGIAIWGWVISIIGAMSLAYVYARLATKKPAAGAVLLPTLAKYLRHSVSRPVSFIIMQTGLVTWPSGLPQFLISLRSSQF